jgi:hypothetical protein
MHYALCKFVTNVRTLNAQIVNIFQTYTTCEILKKTCGILGQLTKIFNLGVKMCYKEPQVLLYKRKLGPLLHL